MKCSFVFQWDMQRIRPYVRVVGNTCAFRMRWVWPSVLHIFHNTYNSVSKIMKSYQGVQLSRKYMQSQISAVKLPTDGLNELQTWKRSLSWSSVFDTVLCSCLSETLIWHSSDTAKNESYKHLTIFQPLIASGYICSYLSELHHINLAVFC